MTPEYPPSYPTTPGTNTTAIISLIVSLLGVAGVLPFIGSIAGIITGQMAKTEIARSGGMQTGEGLAQAGVIIGWIGLLLWGMGVCAALLFAVVLPIFGFSLCAMLGILEQVGRHSVLPLILPFV